MTMQSRALTLVRSHLPAPGPAGGAGPAAKLAVRCLFALLGILPALPASAQYTTGFEPPTYSGSPAGVLLTGQGGWTSPGTGPFRVFTSTSGALGLPASPAGEGQFIAASATGDDFVLARHPVSFAGADVFDITVDFCFRYEGELPASSFVGGLSAGTAYSCSAGWDDRSSPTTDSMLFSVFDQFGEPVEDSTMEPRGLLADHWYRQRTRVDFAAGRIIEIETRDLTSGGEPFLFEPVGWYLQSLLRPGRIDLICLGYNGLGNQIAGFDNVTTDEPAPPPSDVLAFGLNHEPLNGATLEFDVDGNLIVNSGAGPGAGVEDVSVHIGEGAGLSYSISPDDDLSQLGQEVTSTMRGTVNSVPGTLVARSIIAGTGTSALLTVDFPLDAAEGQRARLYDELNRLIVSVVVPNASTFTLTSPLRATISSTRSNSKGGLIAVDGGVTQLEHVEEFAGDLAVTHASFPGETWPKVKKVYIQSLAKQGQPIRGVETNLGKKPVGSGAILINKEAGELLLPGSAKGLAAFSTSGSTTITPLPDAVVLSEPPGPGGGPALFSIADRGMPGELRRGKKRATVEIEPVIVGALADGSFLKTTANILLKGKQCPPNCFDVSVTETKVPGGPLPVEITADFTDLGSTTHRVTVLLDGVVLGVHTGVGPVIGYAEEFTNAKEIRPATPITRGPGDPVKGIDIGLIKKPPNPPIVVQIAGTPYAASEIRIEPEFPIETVEAIDDVSLQSQGLVSITVTSAGFEDAALLVGGLPVSLAGDEAVLDIDTHGQLAVTGIGGTGQDGYTVDLSVSPPGYATLVPRLPPGGTSEGRYDLDITTGTVSMKLSPAPGGGGDDLSLEPIVPGGTYDLHAYKRRLKIFADDDRTGEAIVLVGGTKPIVMEQFIEDLDGTLYAVLALTIEEGTGAVLIDGAPVDTDEVHIVTPVPAGSEIRKLDYRLTTDRANAVYVSDHALLGPGRLPFAGLGEAKLEPAAGATAATGLGSSGQDGFVLKAIGERGVQVYDAGWQELEPTAPAGSSVTTTGSFAGLLDPTTTLAAKKRDRKREDGRFDVTADFTALGSSTVRVGVLSQGVLVADLPGHGPDIGIAQTAPIGAGAGTAGWAADWSTDGVSSTYPAATEFIIDGQTYTGDQLALGAEGRAAADLLLSLSITTVGYERIVLGEMSFEPIPICYADLNADGLVDFSDYLEFLNLFDAQSPYVDFNQDGLVDFSDYLEFLNYYDAGC